MRFAGVAALIVMMATVASSTSLRKSRVVSERIVEEEKEKEDKTALLQVSESRVNKKKDLDIDFGYKSPKSDTGSGMPRAPKKAQKKPATFPQNAPRFQRVQSRVAPQFPGMPFMGGPYTYGSNFGRGAGDFNNAMYGAFANHNYGPIGGGPLSPMSGMGSLPPMVDPRGFGMMGNVSEPWDLGSHPFMPSFGKQMVPGMPFPTQLQGYDNVNQYGMPPFTGNRFTSMGAFGPYTMEGQGSDGKPKTNTTLMGPLPFGPYGKSLSHPVGMNGFGQMPWNPYQGPVMGGGMMGGGMMGGGMMGGGMMGAGVQPRYNPVIAMHHAAMMGGGEQTYHTPGLVFGSGSGYPSPDMDRYSTVIMAPPPPEGGEAAKAAA